MSSSELGSVGPGSTEPGSTGPGSTGPESAGGSIRLRISLALVGVSLLTLVAVGLLFYGFLGTYVLDQQQGVMVGHAEEVAAQVEALREQVVVQSFDATRALNALLRIDLQVLPPGAGIFVVSGSRLVAHAGPGRQMGMPPDALVEEARQLADGGPSASTFRLAGDARLIVAAAPVDVGTGEDSFVLITLATADAVGDRGALFRILVISGVVGMVFSILMGALLAGWLNRPLKRLSRAAGAMAGGSYSEPISGTYPDEVYELAAGLETMRREVRRSEGSLRGFVASAAHELRTPLTSIQGFSQALLDGTAESDEQRRRSAAAIFRESSRLRRLVDALLVLSRFDSREFRPSVVRVDVGAQVAEEVERLVDAGLVGEGRVRVTTSPPEGATVGSDPDMLRQIIANLLRNAAQYGGQDPIVVRAQVAPTGLTLEVENGGIPMTGDEREKAFERFYRASASLRTEGFGLGLPLVREISGVLGGSVELVSDDSATIFRVILPDLESPPDPPPPQGTPDSTSAPAPAPSSDSPSPTLD